SGFAIENYQSNYWTKRGNPRFYRFVVNDWHNAPVPVLSNLAQVGSASNQVLSRPVQPFPASGKSPALIGRAPSQAYGQQSAKAKTEPSAQTTAKAPAQKAQASAQIQAPASVQMKPEASGQMKVEASGQMKLEASNLATKNAGPHDEVLVSSRATPL